MLKELNNNGRVIVHIGMHKTATTFLQLEYLPLLNTSLFKELRFWDRLGLEKLNNDLIISSEGISGIAWNEKWLYGKPNNHHWIDSFKTAIENLKFMFPDCMVIIVFRKHGDLLLSMYKQYIQEGGVLGFKDFYHEEGVIREVDLNFQKRIEFLESCFEQVQILSFEDFKNEGVTYFNSFFNSIGIDSNMQASKDVKRNKSISGSKVEALRKINFIYKPLPIRLKKLLNYLNLSPRRIFQKRLSFWQPKDSDKIKDTVIQLNKKFEMDWLYVESKLWNRKIINNNTSVYEFKQ